MIAVAFALFSFCGVCLALTFQTSFLRCPDATLVRENSSKDIKIAELQAQLAELSNNEQKPAARGTDLKPTARSVVKSSRKVPKTPSTTKKAPPSSRKAAPASAKKPPPPSARKLKELGPKEVYLEEEPVHGTKVWKDGQICTVDIVHHPNGKVTLLDANGNRKVGNPYWTNLIKYNKHIHQAAGTTENGAAGTTKNGTG